MSDEVISSAQQAAGSAPKVFISHSTCDKDRFVLRFAERLRSVGIDAWVDRWEMLPGDSLIDKIFEDGLKDAASVIVILSQESVQSKWVREELNAAVVKRIQTNARLIPLLIDKCDVPSVLSSTLWVRIADVNSYDKEFERVVAAIFNATVKPPLGPRPGYAHSQPVSIPGLEQCDTLVLKCAGESVVRARYASEMISVRAMCEGMKSLDISEELVVESVELLRQLGYVRSSSRLWFQLTQHGFHQYLVGFREAFNQEYAAVSNAIVNQEVYGDGEIAEATKIPRSIVQHIINSLEGQELIRASRTNSGYRVYDVTVQFRRAVRG